MVTIHVPGLPAPHDGAPLSPRRYAAMTGREIAETPNDWPSPRSASRRARD